MNRTVYLAGSLAIDAGLLALAGWLWLGRGEWPPALAFALVAAANLLRDFGGEGR